MKSPEIRRTYLKFFEGRGHTIHPSDSLVPENDPSLLFTGAGMNQFKDMFLGRGHLPFRRATTSQKCLRLPDLDNVGRTPSHHTFFEMLGNFSFGDYFKEDAIVWADELLRTGFGVERRQLCVSVFETDDEAATIWARLSYPKNRIFRYGEKDNFWPSEAPSKGPNGPCGPCSEIYYDFGADVAPELGADPSTNGQRFVEIWNLVFTQFDRCDGGQLAPLPQKNIDTGMGLERLTRVLARAKSNFETDLFQPILRQLEKISGKGYGAAEGSDRPMRRIADHIRAVVFAIADGVVPSNERQGYIVRKILRRALADGLDRLGIKEPFLAGLAPTVISVPGMTEQFPELERNRGGIVRAVEEEEHKFLESYRKGSARLQTEIERLKVEGQKMLSGKAAFFLWDTAGFPIDLTRRTLEEQGLSLEEEGFQRAMEEQKSRSRAGSNLQGEIFSGGPLQEIKRELPPSVFRGYETQSLHVHLRALLRDNERVQTACEGDSVVLVFDETPFYAEGGGQVGDRGEFSSESFRVRIEDTRRVDGYHLHHGSVTAGSVSEGQSGTLAVHSSHRAPTQRNHTATHLLHWALRRTLGSSVEQRGSLVDADRLRFDFNHASALTREQIQQVEDLVNDEILANVEVLKIERSLEEALEHGAVALFGEKYGERVRVVQIKDPHAERCSAELCGGTHVDRTGEIGSFKILSESSVSAGIRRMEAVTGLGTIRLLREKEDLLRGAASSLKASEEEIHKRITTLQEELKKLRKEVQKASHSHSDLNLGRLLESERVVESVRAYTLAVEASQSDLMSLVDGVQSRSASPGCIVILIGKDDGGAPVVVFCDKEAQNLGLHAGNLCSTVTHRLAGRGGGNAGLARGKGSRFDLATEAIDAGLAQVHDRLAGRS